MQTLQNKIVVPTNSDPYDLTDDLAAMGNATNAIIVVASAAARDALTGKFAGMTVYRTDTARMEIWNSSRWSVPATLERGYDYRTPSLLAQTNYVTVASTTFTSLGGKLKLSYAGVVENANSGANRTADVQFLIDNTTEFGGVTFNVPLVSGVNSPPVSVSMERELDVGAGQHNIQLQARASAASAVRLVLFGLTVKENP